jgi:hypothetical protein
MGATLPGSAKAVPWIEGAPSFQGLVPTTSGAWHAALARLPHDFYQLPAYAELCAATDGGIPCAYIELDRDFTFIAPILLIDVTGAPGITHATCPYGYPGPIASPGASSERVQQVLTDMSRTLAQHNVISLFSRVHPLLPLFRGDVPELGPDRELMSHGETVSMDLELRPEESWAKMRSTHRRHILRARRDGLTVSFSWDHLPEFERCYNETMRRVGAGERYYFGSDYLHKLRDILGSSLHLVTVLIGGVVACGGLFCETSGLVQYHLGGTRDDYLAASPAKLLFDEVRLWGHARGHSVLHLGGGVGAQADSLLEFKGGFSDRRHQFHTLRMITNRDAYQGMCEKLGISADLSGYFPQLSLAHPPPSTSADANQAPTSTHPV